MSEKCEAMNYCPVYRIYEHLSSSEAGEHLLNAKKEMVLLLLLLRRKKQRPHLKWFMKEHYSAWMEFRRKQEAH